MVEGFFSKMSKKMLRDIRARTKNELGSDDIWLLGISSGTSTLVIVIGRINDYCPNPCAW